MEGITNGIKGQEGDRMTKKKKQNIFETLDEVADIFGDASSIQSFSELFTQTHFMILLGLTLVFGFRNFYCLGVFAIISLIWVTFLSIFMLYCKMFRQVIIF